MNDFILCHLQWKWKCNLQWKEMATSANKPQPATCHASADHVQKEVNRAHKSSKTGVAVIHLSRSVDPHSRCFGFPPRVERRVQAKEKAGVRLQSSKHTQLKSSTKRAGWRWWEPRKARKLEFQLRPRARTLETVHPKADLPPSLLQVLLCAFQSPSTHPSF